MKIIKIDENTIYFDNGYKIETEGVEDCCAVNYADLGQIEEITKTFEFETDTFTIEATEVGFRFGDCKRKFFIPCYSYQNGYYSNQTIIELKDTNNKTKIKVNCCGEERGIFY